MSDRGSITFWTLGLAILMLGFGGLSVDLWRALAAHSHAAAVADAAAVAAGSAIDVDHYRETGEVLLDLSEVVSRVAATASSQQGPGDPVVSVVTASDRSTATVEAVGEVELGLLRILLPGEEPIVVRAAADVIPVFVP